MFKRTNDTTCSVTYVHKRYIAAIIASASNADEAAFTMSGQPEESIVSSASLSN